MAQVITTILFDDNPSGLQLIELAGWSGKVFVVPRTKLKAFRERKDAQEPGVYFLFGEGVDKPRAYIGQSEGVAGRLSSHDANREEDEWNVALVFVGALHSTFIKYLESVAVDRAKNAGRYEIFNNATPRENTLTEAQRIVADEFFQRMQFITAHLGYTLFQVVKESLADTTVYHLEGDQVNAKAQLLEDGSLNVLKGSIARVRETNSFTGWAQAARKKFIEDGTLKVVGNGEIYEFTRDVVFKTPSAAAATIKGAAINGWTTWKNSAGKTMDEVLR